MMPEQSSVPRSRRQPSRQTAPGLWQGQTTRDFNGLILRHEFTYRGVAWPAPWRSRIRWIMSDFGGGTVEKLT